MVKMKFVLESLSCPSCIKKIESVLSKQSGVNSVNVLFNTSKVKVEFDETHTSATRIKELIEKLGYPVKSTSGN